MDTKRVLIGFLKQGVDGGTRPVVWVGAGASAAAGYPTLATIERDLRARMIDRGLEGHEQQGFDLFDAYAAATSRTSLIDLLDRQWFGERHLPVGLHHAIARLAAGGCFASIYTTNYDDLIEDALKPAGVDYRSQVLQQNFELQADRFVVLKVHGDNGSWKDVVLTRASYDRYRRTHPELNQQLNLTLRTRPILFVGCSMRDPRIVDWLRKLKKGDRASLHASYVLITEADWESIPPEERELFAECSLRPILVADHAAIGDLLADAAKALVPLDVDDLIFNLDPGDDEWTIVGPTAESPPHRVNNPFRDKDFLGSLIRFRRAASKAVFAGSPEETVLTAQVGAEARALADRVTATLLSDAARGEVIRRLGDGARPRARLTIRVARHDVVGDQALALPWELLSPDGIHYPVENSKLDVVREALVEAAATLDVPTEPLSLAVTVAAPEDQTQLSYDDESFRLYQALRPHGHDVRFTSLGELNDLVGLAARMRPTVIHFSGHGSPGKLWFEDELGFGRGIAIEELVTRLNTALIPAGEPSALPKLFWLASCHGATLDGLTDQEHGDRDRERDPELARCEAESVAIGRGTSSSAALHRAGFVQVIGYFGPVSDALCTRAEEVFYQGVAAGRTTLQAVTEARQSLREPLRFEEEGTKLKVRYPLAWTQLALYHRGPDRPLAKPGVAMGPLESDRRETTAIGGLPVLEIGFVGRRRLLHEVRRKLSKKIKLLVLHGLGGLGKTALATHLLKNELAHHDAARLVLRGAEIDIRAGDDLGEALWRQVEEHGKAWFSRFAAAADEIRERHAQEQQREIKGTVAPEPPGARSARGFAECLALLVQTEPSLVIYVDNAENLQEGPSDGGELGEWKREALPVWERLVELAKRHVVLVSTRYAVGGIARESMIPLEPMSPADSMKLIASFPELGRLSSTVQARLAERVDGHPRTAEFLDDLVGEQKKRQSLLTSVDEWSDLVEPILPDVGEKITADLLLEKLWERLSDEARRHAAAMLVLRRPAPGPVIAALGSAADELIGSSLLTRFPEIGVVDGRPLQLDAWGMHRLTNEFIDRKVQKIEFSSGADTPHQNAGRAYAQLAIAPNARWNDREEAVEHLHCANLGDEAFELVRQSVIHLRSRAKYAEALALLHENQAAGVSGDLLATNQIFQVQIGDLLGDRSESLAAKARSALDHSETDETQGFALHTLAGVKENQGKYGEAEEHLRASLKIREKSVGKEHPSYGASLHALAGVMRNQGKYGEAEELLRASLKIKEKSVGKEHPDYAASLHSLADVMENQGKYGEAEEHLRASLKIDEKSVGKEHPSYAASLHALAGVMENQGKYGEAEELLRASLKIKEKSVGKEHPDYAASLHALAGVMENQGKYGEAEELLRASLKTKEKSVGKEHPSYAASLHALAGVMENQGKYGEAEELLRASLKIKEKSVGKEHPSYGASLHALAGVMQKQGKYGEAEELLRASLRIHEKSVGKEHPSYAASLTNLGSLIAQAGRPREGVIAVQEALDITRRTVGEESPNTAQILNLLAQVQASAKDPDAPATARAALSAMRRVFGDEHPLVRNAGPRLSAIADGSPGDSEANRSNAAAEGANPIADLFSAAQAHLRGGRAKEAVSLLTPLVEGVDGSAPVELVASLASLYGQALFLDGRHDEARAYVGEALERIGSDGAAGAVEHLTELLTQMEQASTPPDGGA